MYFGIIQSDTFKSASSNCLSTCISSAFRNSKLPNQTVEALPPSQAGMFPMLGWDVVMVWEVWNDVFLWSKQKALGDFCVCSLLPKCYFWCGDVEKLFIPHFSQSRNSVCWPACRLWQDVQTSSCIPTIVLEVSLCRLCAVSQTSSISAHWFHTT